MGHDSKKDGKKRRAEKIDTDAEAKADELEEAEREELDEYPGDF